jgi:hypothetical protein
VNYRDSACVKARVTSLYQFQKKGQQGQLIERQAGTVARWVDSSMRATRFEKNASCKGG